MNVVCIQPGSHGVAAAAGTNDSRTAQRPSWRSAQDAVSGSSRKTSAASRGSEAEGCQSSDVHVNTELTRPARRRYHHAGSENTGQLWLWRSSSVIKPVWYCFHTYKLLFFSHWACEGHSSLMTTADSVPPQICRWDVIAWVDLVNPLAMKATGWSPPGAVRWWTRCAVDMALLHRAHKCPQQWSVIVWQLIHRPLMGGLLHLVQRCDGSYGDPWWMGCYIWYSDVTVATVVLDGWDVTFGTLMW